MRVKLFLALLAIGCCLTAQADNPLAPPKVPDRPVAFKVASNKTPSTPAVEVEIEAPTEAEVMNPVYFKLHGVPSEHHEKTTWGIVPTHEGDIFHHWITREGLPVAEFWSRHTGLYTVIADVNCPPDDFFLLLHQFDYTGEGPEPPIPPLPPIPEPSARLRSLVAPVAAIIQGHNEDGVKLAHFYLAFADVIRRDTGIVTMTRSVRQANVKAGGLMFQETGIKKKYLGLPEAINDAVAVYLGLEDVPLTVQKRQDAVDVFMAVAWACAPRSDND